MNYLQFLKTFDITDSFYARSLYAQSAVETGNFTSNIYTQHNNLFGMRPSQKRTIYWDEIYHSPNPKAGSFASYHDIKDSVLDRVDLDEYNDVKRPNYDSDVLQYFIDVQQAGYAGDQNDYYEIVYNRYESLFPQNIPLGSPMLEAVGVDYTNDVNLPITDNDEGFNWKKLVLIVAVVVGVGFLIKKFGFRNRN